LGWVTAGTAARPPMLAREGAAPSAPDFSRIRRGRRPRGKR
jgi:hypothetical protein